MPSSVEKTKGYTEAENSKIQKETFRVTRERGADPFLPYAATFSDGSRRFYGDGEPVFEIRTSSPSQLKRLFNADAYSVAMAFIRGEFIIHGDLISAVRFYRSQPHSLFKILLVSSLARFGITRMETWFQTKARAAHNVRYHYDQPTEFYKQLLDCQMVYSCAYFRTGEESLDQAQSAKLHHICRKLDLQPDELFLDVGCGWGALLATAAGEYGVDGTGCTLSPQQYKYALDAFQESGLTHKATVLLRDYRELDGRFDKIASVGMYEHVGRRRLDGYFAKLFRLLKEDGLVLNHGLTRPETSREGPETAFLRKKVFPGSEIPNLSEVVRSAERAGFEVVDVESLGLHYALTCREWVSHLHERALECLKYVDLTTYRTWLLALATSVVFFEDGLTNVHQILLRKSGMRTERPLTREYMYPGT